MSKPTPQDAATKALQKQMADASRAKVQARMLQHLHNAPPGAQQMAQKLLNQGGVPGGPVVASRTASFVIAENPLFQAAVLWGEHAGFLKLQKGERVLGGRATVTSNGIFAELQIGQSNEPEEKESPQAYLGSVAERPDEEPGDALDILSDPPEKS